MKVNIIGIGAGNPAHLTGEAIAALRAVDVFPPLTRGVGPTRRATRSSTRRAWLIGTPPGPAATRRL